MLVLVGEVGEIRHPLEPRDEGLSVPNALVNVGSVASNTCELPVELLIKVVDVADYRKVGAFRSGSETSCDVVGHVLKRCPVVLQKAFDLRSKIWGDHLVAQGGFVQPLHLGELAFRLVQVGVDICGHAQDGTSLMGQPIVGASGLAGGGELPLLEADAVGVDPLGAAVGAAAEQHVGGR